MTRDKYIIKELNAKIANSEAYNKVRAESFDLDYGTKTITGCNILDQLMEAKPIKAVAVLRHDEGYIKGLKFALNLIKYKRDENAETLEDKLRDEHRPTLEELDAIVDNRPQP